MSGSQRRTLRIDDKTIEKILTRLDVREERIGRVNARRSQRYSYRAKSVLVQFPQGDTIAKYAVPCRNLSRDGVAFLVGQFVYPGTACGVRLVSEYNYATVATGRVVRCRYLEGTAGVHEVGVAFDQPIDIAMFHRGAFSLHLLLVDDDPAQVQLLKSLLGKHNADIVHAGQPDEAAKLASARSFDLVLVNMDGRAFHGCDVVAELRRAAYVRPITTLTTLSQAGLDEHCRRRDCSKCTPTAMTREAMSGVLHSLKNEPVVSSLAHDQEMVGTINEFVRSMGQRVAELEQAAAREERQQLMGLVRRLKMFSEGCGFEIITEAATGVEEAHEGGLDERLCRDRFNALVRLCLAARPASVIDEPARQ